MSPSDKPLVWLQGEIRTPPFSKQARLEAGFLLRLLQKIVILAVFPKKTGKTPKEVIDACRQRLQRYDSA